MENSGEKNLIMHQKRITKIVAEMACSHDGSYRLMKKIIDASFHGGADIIQLQIWKLKHMMTPSRSLYKKLKAIEFSYAQWGRIVEYTRKKYPTLKIYVCVYEHNSLDFINSLGVDGYKINSSDLTNYLVLEKISSYNKKTNLSVGASSLDEIQFALDKLQQNESLPITLMYGHQNFPTHPSQVNLNYMKTLGELFDLPYGYQDHCDADEESAYWLPAASLGMNASIIEKHITHDRSLKGVDYESALNPDEFAKFVKMVKTIDSARGTNKPHSFSESEISYRKFQKKTVVAAKKILAGDPITTDNIYFMRAEKLGVTPDQVNQIIGRNVKSAIEAYQVLKLDDVL
jgi:sialic acid synthase SpsE